ncbi:MAG: glycosyltransferase [Methanobacteriaceae archaeon]|nr:glycosyltransferase [Methanobacteriaceae archaeon]
MNTAKISIIIPVYNVEKYLEQCLESVINQTMRELEIICVNDGSTDSSPEILEEFAQKDERIKIIHKENGGIASARNEGLKYVTGEYIGFVDSDDWIEHHMYETLYNNAKSKDCDMVMCSAHVFDDMNQKMRNDMPYFTLERLDESFDGIIFDHTHQNLIFGINVTAWNKLYESKFIQENNIRFQEGLDFEDNPFFYETYLKARNVSLIRDPLYFYRVNRKGSFITSGNKRFFDIVPIHRINEDIIKENYPKYLDLFYNYKIHTIIPRLKQVDTEYKEEFLEIIKEDFAKMDSKEINKLNEPNHIIHKNVMISKTYREYELNEKISYLEKSQKEKLHQQAQEYESKLNQEKIAFDGEIKYKNNLIKEITSSTSWKITLPLRKTKYIMKKIYKKLNN